MQCRYGCKSLFINSIEDWEIYDSSILEPNTIPVNPYDVQDDFMRFCSLVQVKDY